MNWANLTERAQKAVWMAQESASSLGNDFLDTDHLLIGLSKLEEGIAYEAMVASGIDLHKLVDYISDQVRGVKHNNFLGRNDEIILTPRAKKVLDLAEREAINLGDGYISTEHILLAIVHEGGGVGVRNLEDEGGFTVVAGMQGLPVDFARGIRRDVCRKSRRWRDGSF